MQLGVSLLVVLYLSCILFPLPSSKGVSLLSRDVRELSISDEVKTSLKESSDGELVNVTVPDYVKDLYNGLSHPNASGNPLFAKINSIYTFEADLRGRDQCGTLEFPVPKFVNGTQFNKSEIKIYHKMPAERLQAMSDEERTTPYVLQICYATLFSQNMGICLPFSRRTLVTPETVGWVTFTIPHIHHFLTVLTKSNVRKIKVHLWIHKPSRPGKNCSLPLNFIMSDSSDKRLFPAHIVYAVEPQFVLMQNFINEALKTGLLLHPGHVRGRQQRDTTDRIETTETTQATEATETTEEVPTATVEPSACSVKPLEIAYGWQLEENQIFGRSVDIGYCNGYCSDSFAASSLDVRTNMLKLARVLGYINPVDYPEKCVPDKTESLVVLYRTNGTKNNMKLQTIENLRVKSCKCAI